MLGIMSLQYILIYRNTIPNSIFKHFHGHHSHVSVISDESWEPLCQVKIVELGLGLSQAHKLILEKDIQNIYAL